MLRRAQVTDTPPPVESGHPGVDHGGGAGGEGFVAAGRTAAVAVGPSPCGCPSGRVVGGEAAEEKLAGDGVLDAGGGNQHRQRQAGVCA